MDTLNGLKKLSKKALIIAAHPDDESLFMGGTIAEFKRWRWTILCVTDCDKRYNNRRREELLKAVSVYNRKGSDVNVAMLGIIKKKNRLQRGEVTLRMKAFLNQFGSADIVFTHNSKGEYGHKSHKVVHNVVKKLKLPNVYYFCLSPYQKRASKNLRIKSSRNLDIIGLSPTSLRIKRKIIRIYLKGSQKTNLSRQRKILSYVFSAKIEGFNIHN